MKLVANTMLGRARGVVLSRPERPVAAFLGLPYAAAPVGELRWAAPAPAPAWTDERDASGFGPIAPQNPDPLAAYLGQRRDGPQSEDCLSVNVWTPSADAGGRPVLAWIHGGAFISGTSGAPVFEGAGLSARADVVVVSFNYRVGALGFLHLDGARGGPACSNLGLRDQIAALRWIRDNVASFGGDPDKVTIFGESAGGGSVCALLAAPSARGLFRGAIAQSGAPNGVLSPDEASERSARLLELAQLEPAQLRTIPVDALLEAQRRCAADRQWRTGMLFTPVVDGELLPRAPTAAICDKQGAPVPLLIGSNRDELQLFKLGGTIPEPDEQGLEAAMGKPVLQAYRKARAARSESLLSIDILLAFHAEISIRGPAIRIAERRSAPTFMYLFDWPSPAMDGALGAHHALEVPFCFGTLDAPGVSAYAGEGEVVTGISELIMDAWIEFARSGDPGTEALGPWPRYDPEARMTMVLGAEPALASDPRAAERLATAMIVAATSG